MGITINDVRFLLNAKREGVSFQRTITLGRLQWFVKPASLTVETSKVALDPGALQPDAFKDGYSEAFFHALGAEKVDSMDVSDYEHATVLHDMNQPLPDHLKGAYSVVFDGGTLEHIFNFPQAIRNCMELVRVGGHFLGCCPANNQMGHGFYQFSPELWFRVFSPENGFAIEHVLLYAHHGGEEFGDWYEVADPQQVRDRVTLVNQKPAYLLIQAKRVEAKPLFTTTPQQSDYQATWATVQAERETGHTQGGILKRMYRAIVPRRWRDVLYKFRREARAGHHTHDLGVLDVKHYKRFDPKS